MKGPKLAVLLVIGAIGVGFQNYVFFSGLPDAPKAAEEPEEEEERAVAAATGVEELAPQAVAAWLASQGGHERSPFLTEAEAFEHEPQDVLAAGESGPALQLSGTLWSAGRRVAWINGRPRSEGDWVGQNQLVRIESRRVVLMRDGRRIPLGIHRARTAAEAFGQTSHAN